MQLIDLPQCTQLKERSILSSRKGERDGGARATVGNTPEATATVSNCRYGLYASYLLSGCNLRVGLKGGVRLRWRHASGSTLTLVSRV